MLFKLRSVSAKSKINNGSEIERDREREIGPSDAQNIVNEYDDGTSQMKIHTPITRKLFAVELKTKQK